MRQREEMLAFQKKIEDLKDTEQTCIKKKVPYVKFLSYFMFYIIAFPLIRKQKVWFFCGRWSEALLVFHSCSRKQIEDCPEINTVSQYGWRQFSFCTELCDLWKTAKNVWWYVV